MYAIVASLFMSKDWVSRNVGYFWGRGLCIFSLIKVGIKGLEHLEDRKSYVFVANHSSTYDVWVMYGWIGRTIQWVMKKELMKIPVFGWATKASGQIAIDRSNTQKAIESIIEAKKRIKDGVSIVFFPEGTRSRNGLLGRFKKGAFYFAIEMHLDIVPVVIKGAYNIKPAGSFFANYGRIQMEVLKPICIEGYKKSDLPKLIDTVRGYFE